MLLVILKPKQFDEIYCISDSVRREETDFTWIVAAHIIHLLLSFQHAKEKGDKRMNMLRRLAGGGRKKSKSPPTVGAEVEPTRPQQPPPQPNPQPHAGKRHS